MRPRVAACQNFLQVAYQRNELGWLTSTENQMTKNQSFLMRKKALFLIAPSLKVFFRRLTVGLTTTRPNWNSRYLMMLCKKLT